jgi:hypothetical protein
MVRTRYGKYQTGKLVNIMRGKKKANPFTPEFTDFGSIKPNNSNKKMVGARGFEPPTPDTPCQCATRLRYAPIKIIKQWSNGILEYCVFQRTSFSL